MFRYFVSVLLCLATCPTFVAQRQSPKRSVASYVPTYSQVAIGEARLNRWQRDPQPKHLHKIIELPAELDPIVSIAAEGNLIAYTTNRFKVRSRLGRIGALLTFNIDKIDSADATLKIWNPASGQLKSIVKDETISGFAESYLTRDGKIVVTRTAGLIPEVKLWDAETGALVSILQGPAKWLTMCALSPDGKLFAAGYEDGTARLWSVSSGELKATLGSPLRAKGSWFKRWINDDLVEPNFYVRLYFSADSKLLATIGLATSDSSRSPNSRETKVWDTASGELKSVVPGSDGYFPDWGGSGVAFSPDGSILATTYTERNSNIGNVTANSVKLWSTRDGSLLKTRSHARDPLRFSPDGKRLVSGIVHWDDDGTWDFVAEIWNVETGKLEQSLLDPKGSLDEIIWSPDGRTLATTGGGKNMLTIWDSQSGQQKSQIRLVRRHCFDPLGDCISDEDHVMFSPNGLFLVAANKKSLRLIDGRTGTILETVERIGRPALFLSNGQLVTRRANKKSIVVWEILEN